MSASLTLWPQRAYFSLLMPVWDCTRSCWRDSFSETGLNGDTTVPWIDVEALEADINHYLPWVRATANLIPGRLGNTIVAALEALTSKTVIAPVVQLINSLTGATPPTE